MTAAQEAAFLQITELMREHFDSGVFIVESACEEEHSKSFIETTWHGGYATSIGLVEVAKLRIWEKKEDAR